MINSKQFYFLKHNLTARIFRNKKPLLASFKITYRCNLQCRSCPFWKMNSESMSFEQAKSVIDELHKLGTRMLIFEGGEPLLWRDGQYHLEDLIIYAKEKFFFVGFTTNGTLHLESKADAVWISFDGMKETHELNRGESFDKIVNNIQSSTHENLYANITINKLNYNDIPALIRFLPELVKGITIQFYYPFLKSENLWLPSKERIQVLDQLIALKKEGFPILDSVATLTALKRNTWKCHDWLIANAEPDGSIRVGCYLKNRAEISCYKCGFAAHVEISKAYDWNFSAIWVGKKTFKLW